MQKQLTLENWNENDPSCSEIVQWSLETDDFGPLFPERWVEIVLRPKLNETIPDEIKDLFEVGRALMIYGYFYYPFFGLAMEQLPRVTEAAVSRKYEMCGGPPPRKEGGFISFAAKNKWLVGNGHLNKYQKEKLDSSREARNIGSHLKKVSLYPPILSMQVLTATCDLINDIFQ